MTFWIGWTRKDEVQAWAQQRGFSVVFSKPFLIRSILSAAVIDVVEVTIPDSASEVRYGREIQLSVPNFAKRPMRERF